MTYKDRKNPPSAPKGGRSSKERSFRSIKSGNRVSYPGRAPGGGCHPGEQLKVKGKRVFREKQRVLDKVRIRRTTEKAEPYGSRGRIRLKGYLAKGGGL